MVHGQAPCCYNSRYLLLVLNPAADDPSRTQVEDGRMTAAGAKVITPVRVTSERQAEGEQHGSARISWTAPLRGPALAMPALAATRADRNACAASADKPDVGGAACSRIIDDAASGGRTRQGLQEPRPRHRQQVRITTARLPTTARPSSSARRTPAPLRTGARPTRAKRTTARPLRIAPKRSRSIRNMAGPTTTVASPTTACMNTTRRWPTTPRRSR